MVEHPVSMEFDESSSDIELALDVVEESISGVSSILSNGVTIKKKIQKVRSASTIDEDAVDSLDNDLSATSTVEDILEDDKFEDVEVESASCDTVDQSCSTATLEKSYNQTDNKTENCGIKNPVSDSCTKVNGFSSENTNASGTDDTSKDVINLKLNNNSSSLKKLLTNGTSDDMWPLKSKTIDTASQKSMSEETRKSSSDLPILDVCDKFSNNSSDENQVNGDIPKFSDDESAVSALCKRKLDTTDSDDSDSKSTSSLNCLEKRPKVDDSVVFPRSSVIRNNANFVAADNPEPKKKTTARKSTGGLATKGFARLVEKEDCTESQALKADDFVSPIENGVGITDCAETDDLPIDGGRQSPIDVKNTPIRFTLESMSDESLENVYRRLVKRLSRRELEEIVLQKCCEIVSESSDIGEMRKEIAEYKETELFRKHTIFHLEKQIMQLKAVCEVFISKARSLKETDQINSPTVVTRSVGLQVAINANPVSESHFTLSDAGQSSSASSPTKSPRSSLPSDITNIEKTRKVSLPSDNNTAIDSKSDVESAITKNSSTEQPEEVSQPPSDDIVDLTELDDNNDSPPRPSPTLSRNNLISRVKPSSELAVAARHPAPLPSTPKSRTLPGWKLPPPKPNLSIQKNDLAIQMTWDLALNADYEPIEKYQIYAYQETTGVPATISLWKFVGAVESLDLPMACTLTQFVTGYTYHFAVRAVDRQGRCGAFSCAKSITL